MKQLKIWSMLMLMVMMCLNTYAQSDSVRRIKYDKFISKTGYRIKFSDKKCPDIHVGKFMLLHSKIRTFYETDGKVNFLILEKPKSLQSGEYKAMIEYSDLVEINKAFNILLHEVNSDINVKSDYIENTFVSDDGFRIGYYIEKNKPYWIVQLTFYNESMYDLKNIQEFADYLKRMQLEIENNK